MNEIQVQTIKKKPAEIEFNHKDIEAELQSNLKKYEGLTFTSDSTAELRSTLAELRKGKKAVDDYRKKTKKELNEPVKQFEDTCKHLNNYFDEVIAPLDKQLKTFVEQEKEEKLTKLEVIKKEHIETHKLSEDYTDQVVIEDSYLAKSMSLKMASESIEFKVKNLKMEQDKRKADKEVVTTNVKLANSENQLSLSAEAYVRLLEFDDVEDVKKQIETDAERAVKKRIEQEEKERVEEERKEKKRIEREKQIAIEDAKRIEAKKQLNVEQDKQEVIIPDREEYEAMPLNTAPIIDDLPFGDIGGYLDKVYSVHATDEEHEKIKTFLFNLDVVVNIDE